MSQLILLALLIAVALGVMAVPPRLHRKVRESGTVPESGTAPESGRRRIRPGPGTLLGSAVLAVALGVWAWSSSGREAPPVREAAPVLAVLPLTSVGSQEPYVAQGLTEELTTRLGGIRGLRVASSALAREIERAAEGREGRAEELGIDYLLEGSISVEGPEEDRRLTVRVRLVDAETATQVWADVYRQSAERIFEVEGRIARQVATAMQVTVLDGETATLIQPRTTNYAAYDRYLQGLSLRRRVRNPDDARGALTAFSESSALDPTFAAALAGQASIHIWLAWYHGFEGQLDSARVKLDRAAALDPTDEDVRLARALQTWAVDGDLATATTLYRELDADVMPARRPVILSYLAHLEGRRGRRASGVELVREALAVDPFYNAFNTTLGQLLLHEGDVQGARAVLERSSVSAVGDTRVLRWLALIPLLERGDTAAAMATLSGLEPRLRAAVLDAGHFWEARALRRTLGPALPPPVDPGPDASASMQAGWRVAAALDAEARGAGSPALWREAADAMGRLVEREDELAPAYRARARGGLAVALAAAGRHDDAVAVLDPGALPDPADALAGVDLLMARAELEARAGNPSAATVALEELGALTFMVTPGLLGSDPLWSGLR